MALYAKNFMELRDGIIIRPLYTCCHQMHTLCTPLGQFKVGSHSVRVEECSIDQIGFASFAIFERLRQRSTLYSKTPFITRSKGNSIVYSRSHGPSLVSFDISTKDAQLIHEGGPQTPFPYSPTTRQTNLHQINHLLSCNAPICQGYLEIDQWQPCIQFQINEGLRDHLYFPETPTMLLLQIFHQLLDKFIQASIASCLFQVVAHCTIQIFFQLFFQTILYAKFLPCLGCYESQIQWTLLRLHYLYCGFWIHSSCTFFLLDLSPINVQCSSLSLDQSFTFWILLYLGVYFCAPTFY